MQDLYVMVRQNKENPEDIDICCAGSNVEFHYTDLSKALEDKKKIENLYGAEENYAIFKLVSVEDN